MNYSLHKRRFPNDVLVYVEEFNRRAGIVLFDFVDSNEYGLFAASLDQQVNFQKPSMVLLENYKQRVIQENTIYAISPEVVRAMKESRRIVSGDIDSFLIGYTIDVAEFEQAIFGPSVSLNDELDYWLNYYMYGGGNPKNISFSQTTGISVTVRNVGQGNWNEVNYHDAIKVVYDSGAPMLAPLAEVKRIIGNRNSLYPSSKPMLFLSHWDKDHYHSLLAMTDAELKNNFSAFVCRDRVPNLTSRVLFGRISSAIGRANIFAISALPKTGKGGPTYLAPITALNRQIVVYNSQYHKDRNVCGIVLSIKTSNSSAVLSGDVHYEQISRDILPQLNYPHVHHLVVLHHGGKAGKFVYRRPALVSVDKAIISVGTNRYGHPISSNTRDLNSQGFKIIQTDKFGGDITVRL